MQIKKKFKHLTEGMKDGRKDLVDGRTDRQIDWKDGMNFGRFLWNGCSESKLNYIQTQFQEGGEGGAAPTLAFKGGGAAANIKIGT